MVLLYSYEEGVEGVMGVPGLPGVGPSEAAGVYDCGKKRERERECV